MNDWGTGPYYRFNSGDSDPFDDGADNAVGGDGSTYDADSTYSKGYKKYLDNLAKGKGYTSNITIRHSVSVTAVTDRYEKVFKDRYVDYYGSAAVWNDHTNGMLPNGYQFYDTTTTKAPWAYTYGRPFGPKDSQNKKTKMAVTWLSHK